MCGRLKPKPFLLSGQMPGNGAAGETICTVVEGEITPVRIGNRIEFARWEGCARRESIDLWLNKKGYQPCTLPLESFFEGNTEVKLPEGCELQGVIKRFLDGSAVCRNLTKQASTEREKEIAAYHPRPGHNRVPILAKVGA